MASPLRSSLLCGYIWRQPSPHTQLAAFLLTFEHKPTALKKLLLFSILISLLQSSLLAQSTGKNEPYWQQEVNYTIEVTLNDADHTLDGFVKMEYINNSPDTLHFIWIHLWPNAYKNDRTAFTDQALENGSTAFYFSDNDKRGYINRLDFKVNGVSAALQDHPQHQDIVQLQLPTPLPPHSRTRIETPFHVKLPYAFSRGGHVDQTYHITQWYPKPAVYDRKGWHPMPYLDQGEFYAEIGSYDVQITLPQNYIVAATGALQDAGEKAKLDKGISSAATGNKKGKPAAIPSDQTTKTLHYRQNHIHDFAWFADKAFEVKHDTLHLPSGKVIDAYAFHYPEKAGLWASSLPMIKRAILTKSQLIGEYPFPVVSVVEDRNNEGGGMEYPTVTLLGTGGSEQSLDFVIGHEVGHNWFQGILATNERLHPWMDEGMNTYYDNRYMQQQYGSTGPVRIDGPGFIKKKMPADLLQTGLQTVTGLKRDQPIETSSEKFSDINFNLIAYTKTGNWMKMMADELGQPLFDSCMKAYYQEWKFKHPYPEDFRKVMESVSGRDLGKFFSLLQQKGMLPALGPKKGIRFAGFFSMKDADKYHYIFASPAVGYNFYDKIMVGAIFHNYTLPLSRFQFLVAPLYATGSKQVNGLGRLGYTFFPGNNGQKLEIAVAGASFTGDSFTDSTGTVNYQRYSKIVPSLRYVFANKNPRSTITRFLQWKTFLINEKDILFTRDTTNDIDIITYPNKFRYINQLQLVIENNRKLYPYRAAFQAEQGESFVRLNFTGNYYFNYAKGGGMNVRVFAGKFLYLGDRTFTKQFQTDRYHLNMTGPKGYEDYTYSNYFIGRNEFDRFSSQQIMMRDGGFKVRTDMLSDKIGKTDDWLAAANFTTDIPKAINPLSLLPFKLPIKAFVDVGTYAGAWKKDASTGRFLYDAGLQLSLFSNVVNIYVPLLYSKVYKDYIKSTIPDKRFIKNISFSIDIQNISIRKLVPQLPL